MSSVTRPAFVAAYDFKVREKEIGLMHAKLKLVSSPTKDEIIAASITIDLKEAGLCAEDHVFALVPGRKTCPSCGTISWMRLHDIGIRPMAQAIEVALPVESVDDYSI